VNYFPYLAPFSSFLATFEFRDYLLIFIVMNFPDFEALFWMYPASKIEEYQKAYVLKASLLGKIASEPWWSRRKILRSYLRSLGN
jgi:hypothetical protein